MKESRPNIIFLTIDALRFDRLSSNGYPVPTTPNIDRLAGSGISFGNYISHGCPTQFAFPSIFSSTLPLDDGGYDLGITQRGASFVETLKDAGYWTVGLSSGGALTRLFGYDRGFEAYHQMNDISVGLANFWKNQMSYYRTLRHEGIVPVSEYIEFVAPRLDQVLEATIGACQDKLDEINFGSVVTPPHLHGRDFGKIARYLADARAQLESSPKQFVEQTIGKKNWDEVFPLLRASQSVHPKIRRLQNLVRGELLERDITLRLERKYVGVRDLLQSVRRYIERANGRRFFVWAHVIDLHDLSYSDSRIELPPVFSPVGRSIRRLGPKYNGLRRYDYSLANIDACLGEFLEYLRRADIANETLLVLTSDHGAQANWPRSDTSHVANFYEEACHVPLLLVHPGLPTKNVDDLFGSIDLPTTLLDILGLKRPASFKGIAALATNPQPRDFVLMENLGRGPHDLKRKPIQIGIRTSDRKYIAKENGSSCRIREVYDLVRDPWELENLADVPGEADGIRKMTMLADRRCREIRTANSASTQN